VSDPGGVWTSSPFADGEPVAGVTVAVAGAAAFGSAAGAGVGGAAAVTGAVAFCAYHGGSRRIGYSRWMRPDGQVISIRTSTNGSLSGPVLETFK